MGYTTNHPTGDAAHLYMHPSCQSYTQCMCSVQSYISPSLLFGLDLLYTTHKRNLTVQLIELPANPSNGLALSPNHAQPARKPQPRNQGCDTVDSIPPPLLRQLLILCIRADLARLPAHPLRRTPCKMPDSSAD